VEYPTCLAVMASTYDSANPVARELTTAQIVTTNTKGRKVKKIRVTLQSKFTIDDDKATRDSLDLARSTAPVDDADFELFDIEYVDVEKEGK